MALTKPTNITTTASLHAGPRFVCPCCLLPPTSGVLEGAHGGPPLCGPCDEAGHRWGQKRYGSVVHPVAQDGGHGPGVDQ